MRTEDQVRDDAKLILQFDKQENDVQQGTGQVTTFNQLGFKGIDKNKKPDGWYLPKNVNDVAIILETKSENQNINKQNFIEDLLDYIKIVQSKYSKVIGILYNGSDVIVYKNHELAVTVDELQNKEYYISLFSEDYINKQKIYDSTKKINNNLHFNFKINNLYHRMIFTACALVAERYDGNLTKVKDMGYATFHTAILSTLSKSLASERRQNEKIDILLEVYGEIRINQNDSQEDINSFIDEVVSISNSINSDYWNGEDVMAIFFSEFNRYKGKAEHGQVFTPEHIASFMYKLLDVNKDDYILDATCGSGTFLVKCMSNMIQEAGGNQTEKAKHIKQHQLFGIENSREIYALACANMLIHKDGKTNLEQLDTRGSKACEWIKSKNITKVLMNPPYENKYGCMKIVENVLNNVERGTMCAFILPDRKLETVRGSKKLLKTHRLLKIVKLPENTFDEGITTSIFVFEAGIPQGNREIFACNISEDGLERVKNQGRQDIKKKWTKIEDYWIDVITKQTGNDTIQWLQPDGKLEYMLPMEKFEVSRNDFKKTVLDYLLFQNNLSLKQTQSNITGHILYGLKISEFEKKLIETNSLDCDENPILDTLNWKEFNLKDLFDVSGSKTTPKSELDLDMGGRYPYVTTAATNNGIAGHSSIKTEDGEVLTVDSATIGACFYQKESFSASDHVEKLTPKFTMDIYIALFFVTILNINAKRYRYGYERKRSQTELKQEVLYLPCKENSLDYDYMRNYIKSIGYTNYLNL